MSPVFNLNNWIENKMMHFNKIRKEVEHSFISILSSFKVFQFYLFIVLNLIFAVSLVSSLWIYFLHLDRVDRIDISSKRTLYMQEIIFQSRLLELREQNDSIASLLAISNSSTIQHNLLSLTNHFQGSHSYLYFGSNSHPTPPPPKILSQVSLSHIILS